MATSDLGDLFVQGRREDRPGVRVGEAEARGVPGRALLDRGLPIAGLHRLARAEHEMKTSQADARLAFERAVVAMCGEGEVPA